MPEAATQQRQILLCSSREQQARVAPLFTKCECRYDNGGTDWPSIEGRSVVVFGEELAAFAVGYAGKLKVVSKALPDIEGHELRKWIQDNAHPYAQTNPAQVAAPPSPDGGEAAVTANAAKAEPGESSPFMASPDAPAAGPSESPQSNAEPPPVQDTRKAAEAPSEHSGVFVVDSDGWPVPVNFWGTDIIPLPPVTQEMLPGWLWDYCSDQAALRGVDPVQPSLQCLIAISGALHNSLGIRPKPGEPDYIERPVLWGATVGHPSSKKDAGQNIALGPLISIDTEMRRNAALRMVEHSDAEAKYADDLTAWRKGGQIGARPMQPEPMPTDRVLVDSYTMEGLRSVLQHNSRLKVLVAVSELSGLFGNLDAFSKSAGGASKDAPMMLRLYESKSMIVDRAAPAPPVFVKSWAASIAGAIQPSILARIVEKMHLTEDGMLPRFLLAISQSGSAGEERPVDRAAADAYKRMMQFAVAMHPGDQPCNFSPEAQAIRKQFLEWVYRTAGSGALADGLAAAVGKFEGSFSRLALVMHAAECAHAGLPVIAPEVSETTAHRVRELILGFLYPHAARFYRDLAPIEGFGGNTRLPQLVAGFILATGTRNLTTTALWHHLTAWAKMTAATRREVIAALCEAGWLRERSKTQWIVNPAVHSTFEAQAVQEKERRARYAAILDQKMGRVREPGED